jgi:ATP-dependent Clp protease ATP-binding subunit ClpC
MLLIPEQLNEAIMGQDEAVAGICQSLRQTAAGLSDFNKPLGVFLFVGPSGVGKTQAAKALAGILFDSEENFIHLDMAEFSEQHSVSKLIGAPPGYVGYGDEGRLTGKLRDRPYTVVLLDEIEKAHPDVLHLFLSLFDEGRITDAMGRRVDGRSALFIMTSNVGAVEIADPPVGFQNGPWTQTDLRKVIFQEVQKSFSAEFLNRTKVVFFRPLDPSAVEAIGRRLLKDSVRRFEERGVTLQVEEDAFLWICRQGYDRRYGARHLHRAVNDFILGPATEMWLSNAAPKGTTLTIVLRGAKLDYLVAGREQLNDPDATQPL